MKKFATYFIALLTALTFHIQAVNAESFESLWKKVSTATEKDLPQTTIQLLQTISDKAEAERSYGNLLKAQLMTIQAKVEISGDSLPVMVERMEKKTVQAECTNKTLAAVYHAVMGKLYKSLAAIESDEYTADGYERMATTHLRAALANPMLLAKAQTGSFEPAIVRGKDSKIFYNDLLHVIGLTTEDYKLLHDYYAKTGNRSAACITAYYITQQDRQLDTRHTRKSKYLQTIDSLINEYQNLPEAGELAIEHYNFISQAEDATDEQQMAYINYALSHWGAWPRMNILRNAQRRLTLPSFHVSLGCNICLPDTPRDILIIEATNITKLTMSVRRINATADMDLDVQTPEGYKKLEKLISNIVSYTETKQFIGLPNYMATRDTMHLPGLKPGIYLVEFTTDNSAIAIERQLIYVSDLYIMHQSMPGNKMQVIVVNARTGKPIHGANLKATLDNRGKTQIVNYTTDKNGIAYIQVPSRNRLNIYASTADDKYLPEQNLYGTTYSYYKRNHEYTHINIYTDRAIYRPGQTVHVAMLVQQEHNDNSNTVVSDKQYPLSIRDVNGKEVANQQLTTDEYGVASTDFQLPQSCLTGVFSICCNNTYKHFYVEEYKRPTFKLDFDPYKQAYNVGDTITITGHAKSFTGVPVQGAVVRYKVIRRPQYFWRWGAKRNAKTETLLEDSAVTNQDGKFFVRVAMELPEREAGDHFARYYAIEIDAKATDLAGESHENYISLGLSDKPTILSVTAPEKILCDSTLRAVFEYNNNFGQPINGIASVFIDGTKYLTAKTNAAAEISTKALASGKHTIMAICNGDTARTDFILFSLSDKRPPIETHDWFYESSDKFALSGEPIYTQIGSSDKDYCIYYTVFAKDKVIDQGILQKSNALTTQKYEWRQEYGDGILVTYMWVKDGVMYEHTSRYLRELPDRKLQVEWHTFRDKLQPGQQEQWTLHIAKPDGTAAKVHMIATLYDATLDQLRSNLWDIRYYQSQSIPFNHIDGTHTIYNNVYGEMPFKPLNEPQLNFSSFDDNLFDIFQYPRTRLYKLNAMGRAEAADGVMLASSAPAKQMVISEVKFSKERVANNYEGNVLKGKIGGLNDDTEEDEETHSHSDNAAPTLRENFNETAFFMPNLLTDDKGDLKIRFTLPESVTTWNFIGVSHDKDMNHAITTKQVIAQKVVMVQPNMPRFLRHGDKGSVQMRIINTQGKQVRGTARLQLIDAQTERTLLTKATQFVVQPNGQTALRFQIDASTLPELLIARFTAEGKGFSDGEQHYLAVLPGKELVTNTLPFTLSDKGTTTLNIQKLFPTTAITDASLTLEYTAQPEWLMLQALPSVGTPSDKNAISLASAFYANSIANHILHSNPSFKNVIEQWSMENDKNGSLQSALAKNQELKSIVLDETPWLATANKEAEQKQQLRNYFNQSVIDYRLNDQLASLRRLQQTDGSFAWWEGMKGNPYMTMSVCQSLVRLNTMLGEQTQTRNIINCALTFMEGVMAKEVAEIKKAESKGAKNVRPSELAVTYLYVRAIDSKQITRSNALSDYRFLYDHLAKQGKQLSIYGKAHAAIIFGKNTQMGEHPKLAKELLQSIREYTVYTKEMGRYFDTRSALYSWCDYRIPSQTAAIEALKTLTPNDRQTISEMQQWLLQEKRTTCWTTPINSVNAIYAFIDSDKSFSNGAMETPDIKVDGKALKLPTATAGIGYVKAKQDGKAGKISINKPTDGTSWGAVYAQFTQPTTDVASAASGISLKREIFKNGKPATHLKVGDKVKIRLTIKAERDYDFVQIIDRRAACFEPVEQTSGYRQGCYLAPKDNQTAYYFDLLAKGTHIVETEYYIDRAGQYAAGSCAAQCAYSPEYGARAAGMATITIKE